jgi:hypothetical protein
MRQLKPDRLSKSSKKRRDFSGQRLACKGKILLSGYPSKLYDEMLTGWRKKEFDLANHAAGGENKRRMKEVVWMNY